MQGTKRKPTMRKPLPEAKRMKLESEGFRTAGWSGDLTKEEFGNLLVAEKMFDVKRNNGLSFRQLNPLNKRTCYWFYCEEHGYHFHRPIYAFLSKGFAHQACLQDFMGDDFFGVRGYFVSAADGSKFEDLPYGSHVECTWECDQGHVTKYCPKRLLHNGAFFCSVCNLAGRSLKELYPESEKFFISSSNKRGYGELSYGSNSMCTWWCSEMQHQVKADPKHYFRSETNVCKECASMKSLFPALEKYYVTDANVLKYDQVRYGSNKMCTWWCDKLQHKFQMSPKHFILSKDRRCPECNLLSSVDPELFKQLDIKSNQQLGIDLSKLTCGSNRKVFWKCPDNPDHPAWETRVIDRRDGKGGACPACGKEMSAIERNMYNVLKAQDIPFEAQKRFPDLRYVHQLWCDFYITEGTVSKRGVLIEVDGPAHFGIGIMADERIGKRDRIKNIFALNKGLHLLRVDAFAARQYAEILRDFLQAIKHSPLPIHWFRGPLYDEAYHKSAYVQPD